MTEPAPTLAAPPPSPLSLRVQRAAGVLVGRPGEVQAIQQELLRSRSGGLTAITLEGEPGIGKSRLLVAAVEMARAEGFGTIAVSSDEELRGPFLLARAIFSSPEAWDIATGAGRVASLQRAVDSLLGRDDPAYAGLAAEGRLLRTYDHGALALRDLALHRPLALFVDDVQWADEDTLRMLRYVIRADSASPIFLMLALRPEETAEVTEIVTLLADLGRMGIVRRLKLQRFTQVETGELLRQMLRGDIAPSTAATVHAQAEGVPFIVEEVAHAYRDAGLVQQIDGVWTLAKNAHRLLPSAVHTLIQRRAARLPEPTRASLAEAGVLGRSFSLRDLCAVKALLGDRECPATTLADQLAPAVAAGLLTQLPEEAAADYSFTHEQVREFAMGALTPPRRRDIHRAVVQMVTQGGEPPPESLAMLAHHALAAGEAEAGARFAVGAARAAWDAGAPEEVLRLVEAARPAASGQQERIELLRLQDEALTMLNRPVERLEGLAELAALAEARRDADLELEVMLRRSSALRLSDETGRAAELAQRARDLAAERGDRRTELLACLELGQAITGSPLGDSYLPAAAEVDLDAAEETFMRAAALAQELGDLTRLAAAKRELGAIELGRARHGVFSRLGPFAFKERPLEDIFGDEEISGHYARSLGLLQEALELYERLGDRYGVMTTIISLAYASWGPEMRRGSARRIEEIRRLALQYRSMTRESERVLAEIQMLYGVHVYARETGFADLALARGAEAFERARVLGDRMLEFLAAGGVALTHLQLGEVEEAERWLDRAAAAAAASPTALRARQLESWRGRTRACAGDEEGMRRHLERAVALATEQGRPAARCESLARLALDAAALAARRDSRELLEEAERWAEQAKGLAVVLPGHAPWRAQADAALAEVWMARGDVARAAEHARAAYAAREAAMQEDLQLDLLLSMARVLTRAGTDEERAKVREKVRLSLHLAAEHIEDEDVRVRWFRAPAQRELTELVGESDEPLVAGVENPTARGMPGTEERASELREDERSILRLVTLGKTNREIAGELGLTEDQVVSTLESVFLKVGASSRAEATTFAFLSKVV